MGRASVPAIRPAARDGRPTNLNFSGQKTIFMGLGEGVWGEGRLRCAGGDACATGMPALRPLSPLHHKHLNHSPSLNLHRGLGVEGVGAQGQGEEIRVVVFEVLHIVQPLANQQ